MVKRSLSVIFTIITVSLLCSNIYSQSTKLKGKVTDQISKDALFGVNIIIDKSDNNKWKTGTSTDFDGNYEISLPEGTYDVKFHFIGYESKIEKVKIDKKDVTLNISISPAAELISEVVVSAGKYEQKLSDITVSMEVLKPQTLENKNTYNVEQALNKVPGVDINNHQPSIRSCTGWSYGAGNRVMILVDDLPLMSADVGDAKWNYVPTENISQIEVVKGASSALFGSQALGGVINIRTAYPTSDPQTKLNIFYGVYGNPPDDNYKWWGNQFYTSNTGINKAVKVPLREGLLYWIKNPMYGGASFSHSQQFGNLDIVLGGNHYTNEGFRNTEFERRTRLNANLRYRSKLVDGLAFGLNTNFMAAEISDFFMWNSDTTPYISNTIMGATAPTDAYRFNIDPYINYYKENGDKHSLRTRFFRTTNTISNDTMKNSVGDVYYAEYQYQTNIKEHWTLSAGAVENYQEVISHMYGDHFSNEIAAYIQGDARYGRLKVSAGIRGEYFKVDTATTESIVDLKLGKDTLSIPIKPVARLGLNYQVAEATFLRASFGQGYRFPAVSEKFTTMSLGLVKVFPNVNLQPETSWNTEIGAKQGYKIGNWKGFADIALYYQKFHNMMEFGFVVLNDKTGEPYTIGTPASEGLPEMGFQCNNVGNANIYGIDLSAIIAGKIGKWADLTIGIGYTYNNPEYASDIDASTSTEDKTLKYRYKNSLKADFSIETKHIEFGADLIWKSAIKNVDRLFCDQRPEEDVIGDYLLLSSLILPGYWDYRIATADKNYWNIDMHFAFKFRKELKLSFHVKNLLNQVYVGRPGDICAPRRFELSLTANF